MAKYAGGAPDGTPADSRVTQDSVDADSPQRITRARFLGIAGTAIIAILAETFWLRSHTEPADAQAPQNPYMPAALPAGYKFAVVKPDAQWHKTLAPETYYVTRQEGTEPAFDNPYWNNHQRGTYDCADCDQVLFSTNQQYNSGEGWPSFWRAIAPGRMFTRPDHSLGMERTEVLCSRCGAHLGHIFDDGPRPSGLRFCIDSAALKFIPTR
jgi:peptide-methionine (R)-S-oxide reductase